MLVTYDVTGLYTNLKFHEISESLEKDLDEYVNMQYGITDSFQYLHRKSNHATNNFRSFITGECTRYLAKKTSLIGVSCSKIN